MRTSILTMLAELISPRTCHVCGCRLAPAEDVLCTACLMTLPRTGFAATPLDNEMARLLWGRIDVERCAALTFYSPHAQHSSVVYELKYRNRPETGQWMGRLIAREMASEGFFEGIDAIVPVPLAPARERERGYNQSMQIAQGIASVTGLPVLNGVVQRTSFTRSQTSVSRDQRGHNVEHAFALTDAAAAHGRHLLFVDDIVTTGATISACAKVVQAAGDVKVSVVSWGLAK